MAKINLPVRSEIYLVNFDPTLGSEIKKTRPALIIQNDVANEHSPITIVAAITSKFDDTLYPTEVLISAGEGGLKQDSVVLLNQIRSIDRQRLAKKLGKVNDSTLKKVDLA
ncbi:MAG: type II toxin-antitoxin system PemK/MazF family toxin, partial [Acidobacteriota bacterium]|nr:type II toxin-antitoxin system PemK/MazF family toxin [Acidobacteriota bacterium]